MSVYEELIPSFLEQKARGSKPRGRCSTCSRELALRIDDTVGPHNRPNRQGRTTPDVCPGGTHRSMNLTTDRVRPDLDTVEARLLIKAVEHMLNVDMTLDADKKAVLRRALAKMNSPVSRISLTRTEEGQMLANENSGVREILDAQKGGG